MKPTKPILYILAIFSMTLSAMAEVENAAMAIDHPSSATKFSWLSESLLQLETAQRITLENSPTLAAAIMRVDQARARIDQARSAYFPSLDAGLTASRTWLSDSDVEMQRALSPVVDESPESYTAALEASWLLFDGLGREFQNAAARFGLEESWASHRETQRLLLSAVASTFYAGQLARENIAIAESNKAFNLRQLKEAQARLRVGTGNLSDVLNFEIRANEAQADYIRATQSLQSAKIGLVELMGIADSVQPEAIQLAQLKMETPDEMQMPDEQPLIEYAVVNRPDMIQTLRARQRAEAQVGSSRAAFWPSISAFASESGDRSDHARLNSGDFGSTIGIAINYNIFSGGRDSAVLKESKAAAQEAEQNLAGKELEVTADVRSALVELKAAQEQLVLQRANTKFVERNRELVEKEYLAGQGSLVRLNEAQRDLTNQQGRLALAQVSLYDAWHKPASGDRRDFRNL